MSEFSIVSSERYIEPVEETVHYSLASCSMSSEPLPSGKRDRVVICCSALDVPAVVRPVSFYEANRVHMISGEDTEDAMGPIYSEFREEIRSQIERGGYAEVCDHITDVRDYRRVMRTLLTIVRDETERTNGRADIFVNISSGTPEYSAAAMLICMQNRDLTAFTVRTEGYSMSPEEVKDILYADGRPAGTSVSVSDPIAVSTCGPDVQDSELVTCLGVMKEIRKTKRTALYEDIINGLISEGAWRYVPDSRRGRSDDLQKARMHLKRHFLEPMVRKGWLRQDPLNKNRYHITDEGENVIAIYYGLEK